MKQIILVIVMVFLFLCCKKTEKAKYEKIRYEKAGNFILKIL
jgi:hypothetical protein